MKNANYPRYMMTEEEYYSRDKSFNYKVCFWCFIAAVALLTIAKVMGM